MLLQNKLPLSFDLKKKNSLKEFSERINLRKDIPLGVVIYQSTVDLSIKYLYFIPASINPTCIRISVRTNRLGLVSHLFSLSLSSGFLLLAVDVQRKNHKFNQAPRLYKVNHIN